MLPPFEARPDGTYIPPFARGPDKGIVFKGFNRCACFGYKKSGRTFRVGTPVQPSHVKDPIGWKRLLFRIILNLDNRTYTCPRRNLARDPSYGWQCALVADQQHGPRYR